MKIGIFSDAFFPQLNGVVVYTIELVNYLASCGHKVYLVVPKCNDKDIKIKIDPRVKIIKIRGLKMKFYPDFKFTNLLSHELLIFLREKLDIINFQTPFTIGLNAILLAKMMKIPLVGTFHTFIGTKEYLSHLPDFSSKIITEELAWGYIRKFYNPCNLIISPSSYTKKELKENKIESKVEVINIGIDFDSYKMEKSKINIEKDSFVFVGRIATEKNIIRLLQAFNLLIREKTKSKLYLIGDGPQMKEVREICKFFGLENAVVFLGRIENTVIRETDLLSKFVAFVTMSNTENQPVTLIEAMKKGLPLIGPKSKGITEMIDGNGILIDPDNAFEMAKAMNKLIDNRKLREKFSKRSIENSKKHDSKKIFAIVEKKFKNLVR